MIALDQYMSDAKILIVDGNFTHRVALKQTLLSFGVHLDHIHMAKNLSEARKLLDEVKPQIVFSDFILDDGIGTGLIREKKECIFILITSVTTQAAIANAAEMEVDQFIFKPYNQLQLKDMLFDVIQKTSEPGESAQYIEDGKELLSIGEFEKAAVIFEQVKTDPKYYAKACSYLAEIKKLKNDVDSALKVFSEGLNATEVHFRCLIGLFRTLTESGKVEESYSILKTILSHFPECPERLGKALHLAIKTKIFVDIEEMHLVFQLMYEKPERLLKHMSSALLVNGHYHLLNNNPPAAIESFVRAISIGQEYGQAVDYILEKLTEFGLEKKLDEVLQQANIPKAA